MRLSVLTFTIAFCFFFFLMRIYNKNQGIRIDGCILSLFWWDLLLNPLEIIWILFGVIYSYVPCKHVFCNFLIKCLMPFSRMSNKYAKSSTYASRLSTLYILDSCMHFTYNSYMLVKQISKPKNFLLEKSFLAFFMKNKISFN